MKTSITFAPIDYRFDDDRFANYDGRIAWSDELGFISVLNTISFHESSHLIIYDVWVTKIDSKSNCGLAWSIVDDRPMLADDQSRVMNSVSESFFVEYIFV